jgi:hypothetical protein
MNPDARTGLVADVRSGFHFRRRALYATLLAILAGMMLYGASVGMQATPDASPSASPVASPVASPASPIASPVG